MALALGANTAALSVLEAFLLSSLAVPESDRVVLIAPERDRPGRGSVVFSEAYPNYQLLRQTQHAFADVTVFPATQRTAITGGRQLTVFGRIADGTSFEAARADVNRFTVRAIEASPADNKDFRYGIKPLRDVLLNGADSSALFVQAGAATLLILAILNLASLLVAWGFERRQEMSVRRALGADGAQVVRLLLRQSLTIVAAARAPRDARGHQARHLQLTLATFRLEPGPGVGA